MSAPGRPLTVLHLATSDRQGGAGRAAHRTHRALLEAGLDARVLVRPEVGNDDSVQAVDPLPPWPSRARRLRARVPGLRVEVPEPVATFNFDLPQDLDERALLGRFRPGEIDVVCVHRSTRFLTVRQLRALRERLGCPLVWVLLDQEPVTGGCHYSLGCDGFTRQCGRCPLLRSDDPDDHSHRLWLRKQELLHGLPLTFVAPSADTREWVRRSSLYADHPVAEIRLPIDGDVFRPVDPRSARELLRIPESAKVVLLAAAALDASRKGADHGLEALRALAERADPELRERLFLLAVGDGSEAVLEAAPVSGRRLDRLEDELTLALMYQAADVFLSPTVADAGPMMVPEALLCGVPVAAFALGYARDLLVEPETGGTAPLADADALAGVLHETLRREDRERVQAACRRAAADFEVPRVAAAHTELYRSLIA